MLKVLISSPPTNQVSGISSVVKNLLNISTIDFEFLIVGKEHKNKLIKFINNFITYLIYPIIIYKSKSDIIHINTALNRNSIYRDLFILIIAKLADKKKLLHIHGGKYINQKPNKIIAKSILFLFKNADMIVLLSDKELDFVKKNYLNNTKINVQPNAVDLHKIELVKSEKIGTFKIIYFGRIEKNKGIKEIWLALKELNSKNYDFIFSLIGTGLKIDNIVSEYKNSLGNKFSYHNKLFNEELFKEIKSSSVFLMPSYYEGLPMSLLEAMACGVVPIVTNVGSISTVVKDYYNGITILPKNVKNIVSALEYLINNRDILMKLSSNAKNTIYSNYSLENYNRNFYELYSKLLD